MEHLLKAPSEAIDLNRVRYDLALINAQEKFRFALRHNEIEDLSPDHEHPSYLDEADYLLNQFETALSEYLNIDDQELLRTLDFTYESDSE